MVAAMTAAKGTFMIRSVSRVTWDRIGADTQRTNNTAERLLGLLLKIRSKTMRGFAEPENMLRFVHLAAHFREARGVCELKTVC